MRRCPDHSDKIDRAFDELLAVAFAEYRAKQEKLGEDIGRFARWHCDLAECTLEFFTPAGDSVVESIVPVGT